MQKGIRFKGINYDFSEFKEDNELTKQLPVLFLEQMMSTREWSGKPHVTDLCVGTREAWLKYTTDYYVDFMSGMKMAMGSIRHKNILTSDFSEMDFDVDVKGSADLIDIRPNGDLFLTDIKFYSSYSVAKHLGITVEKRPLVDEFGNVALYKNGKQKMMNYTVYTMPDKSYIAMQLNIYRYFLERIIKENESIQKQLFEEGAHIYANIKNGHVFNRLAVFMYVTDGGTWMAKNRGILRQSYYDTEIEFNPDIESIIETKKNDLNRAMKGEYTPPMCPDMYTLTDRYKCYNFCPVRERCEAIGPGETKSMF
jgi:hypothetical protein